MRQPSADWLVPPEGAGLRLLVKTRNSSVTGEDGPVTSIVSNIMFQRSVAREHFISPKTSVYMFHSLCRKDKLSCFD